MGPSKAAVTGCNGQQLSKASPRLVGEFGRRLMMLSATIDVKFLETFNNSGSFFTNALPTSSITSSEPATKGISIYRPCIFAHSSRASLPSFTAYCSNDWWRIPTITSLPLQRLAASANS